MVFNSAQKLNFILKPYNEVLPTGVIYAQQEGKSVNGNGSAALCSEEYGIYLPICTKSTRGFIAPLL